MARLDETIVVDRPIEEAFAYTADVANFAEWDPGVVESARIGDGPIGVGSEFTVVVRTGSRTIPMRYRITTYEPPNLAVIEGEGSTLHAIDRIEFSAEGDRTRIHYTADITLRGLLRLAEPFMGSTFKRIAQDAMAGLQAKLSG